MGETRLPGVALHPKEVCRVPFNEWRCQGFR